MITNINLSCIECERTLDNAYKKL